VDFGDDWHHCLWLGRHGRASSSRTAISHTNTYPHPDFHTQPNGDWHIHIHRYAQPYRQRHTIPITHADAYAFANLNRNRPTIPAAANADIPATG
jgi:hypothetical protein